MSIDTLQHCKILGHEEVVNDDRLDLHFILHLIILHAVMPRVVHGGRIGDGPAGAAPSMPCRPARDTSGP